MQKTQKEYTEYEDSLIRVFKNRVPNTKEQMVFIMNKKGFRNKRIVDKNGRSYVDHNFPISKKQENYAWDFLKKQQPKQETLGVRFHYVVEKGNKRRSTQYFEYNNKKYYKGRFVPKDLG